MKKETTSEETVSLIFSVQETDVSYVQERLLTYLIIRAATSDKMA